MKFLNLFKKEHTGAIAPEFRRYSAPPMPTVAPCKKEDEFPDFDDLHDKAKDVLRENREKSFDRLIDRISMYMKESALHGSFQSCMIVKQDEYPGLYLSDPDSVDCQAVRDYILSKDSRFMVIIESIDKIYKDRWLKDDGVKLTVKWCNEDVNIAVDVDSE